MREIKFRAWDGMMMRFCGKGGYGDFIIEQGVIVECASVSVYDHKEKDWPLMQYTGLKDSNGVEIYEDDIVSHYNGWVGVTTYTTEDCSFINENRTFGKAQAACLGIGPVKVIGNIHEDPELLVSCSMASPWRVPELLERHGDG